MTILAWGFASAAQAQDSSFDPSWYDPSHTYVKVAVVEDGVYHLTGADLTTLGLPISGITPRTLKLYKNGQQVPLWYAGDPNTLMPEAKIYFVGERNRGDDEAWAYRDRPDWQSSTYYSLYTDTTFYWLSWGGTPGLRYQSLAPGGTAPDVFTFRDLLHDEQDLFYYDGEPGEAENPFFTRGEGTYWHLYRHTDTNSISMDYGEALRGLARDTNPADSVIVRVQMNGRTETRHRASLELETVTGGGTVFTLVDEADWTGATFQTLRAAILPGQVPTPGANTLTVRVTSHNEFAAEPNHILVDWIEYSFVRELGATEGLLRFSFPEAGPRRMHLKGFGNDPVLVFNPAEGGLHELMPEDGAVVFTDRPAAPPTYWAVAASAVRAPAALSVDRSSDWASATNEVDYVIVTARALRASAEIMADYHRSENGFQVAVVDIQDLYDQFDYGRPTPLAIRRFVYQTQQWRTPARFLLLWGDALYADRQRTRPAWEVPSYGKASSDGWLGMQYHGPEDWSEVLAIGRLPIRDDDAGLGFIQKLEAYETTPLETWQKRMLMLVGGRGEAEQNTLQRLVEPWSLRALAAPTGMDTINFQRSTETALDPSFQDTLRVAIREGATWMTYFGHSAATTWEIVTDEPKDFNNAPRLPLAISLGCRTGAFAGGSNVLADTPVLAEKLVLGSLNGAIAHWGTSGLGGVSASARMGGFLHELVFTDTLRTVGPLFQEVKRRYASESSMSLRDLIQFSLIGDPATRLVIPVRPDFHVTQEHLRITPTAPDPGDGELTVAVRLTNRGLVPSDSITVHLIHTAPDGAETTQAMRVAPFRLTKEVFFTLPIDPAFVGTNRFRVLIDPEDAYREVVETNNTAERSQVIFSRDLTLIAPLDMGLSTTQPRLRVSFAAQDAPDTPVLFELDTVPTFDSPAVRRFRTLASGTYVVWSIEEPLESGRPYFWRARLETPDGLINWKEASFFVDENIAGNAWVQAGALFDRNTQDERLSWDAAQRRWIFNTYPVEVSLSSESGSGQFKGQFQVDGIRYERLGLGFGMLIVDRNKGTVRASGSMPTYPNNFEDPADAKAELNALVDLFEDGDYVFVRTRHLANLDGSVGISEDIKAVFRALGSTAIDTLTYQDLWLMRARVGHPEETTEWVEPPGGVNEIFQDEILTFTYGEGQTTSPRIGPAQGWQSLAWQAEVANAVSEVRVDVLDAVSDEVLLDSLTASDATDLSAINAQEHPFLRLQATLADSSQSSTPQLTRWNVHFTSIAELVLDGALFTVSADTVQEGESLTASASIINLSDVPADSVVYRLHLTDALNRTTLAASDTLLGLAPDDTVTVAVALASDGLLGRNVLTLEVEQPNLTELITFNNTALAEFSVRGDRQAPVLTVTVNGEALPHDPDPIRDLQSPDIPLLTQLQATIEIVLSDENTFKPLTDTSLVTVTLDEQRIPFTHPDLAFEPPAPDKNEARVLYTPDFTGEDAVHTLTVRAFDVAGNEAEGSPYQVHFRVESTFEIGSIYPYPNPMSSFTQFAFSLKGADPTVIEDFRIRIYTLTGRVVQEFDLVENPSLLDGGQLHTGWNKIFWDGRDADGDLLATGVYLYKVYMTVEGEAIEVNEAPVEKIVVLR